MTSCDEAVFQVLSEKDIFDLNYNYFPLLEIFLLKKLSLNEQIDDQLLKTN